MDKKELEEVLDKYSRNIDYKLEVMVEDIGLIKENIGHLQSDVAELKEDVAVLKEDVTELKQKTDMIFEQTGKLTVDMEIVKESVQRHEQTIQQL